MVSQVKTAWADLPASVRLGAKIGAVLVGLLGSLGIGDRVLHGFTDPDLAVQVTRNTAAIDTLRTEAQRDRAYIYTELEFITCERKAANGLDGRTLEGCIEDYRRSVRSRQ